MLQIPGLQLKLPGKKLFGNNLDPQFIASRQEGLDMFLQQLMQDKKLLEMLVECWDLSIIIILKILFIRLLNDF